MVSVENEKQIAELSKHGISYAKKIELETKRQQDLFKAINQAQAMINARKSLAEEDTQTGSL